ncbi:MAG: hypothetical protein N2257_10630, partial [Thermodesulfovibrionales bacterium]|nr:hypothetical protein [Thermodesulfovibrionales bacterium]
SPPSQNQIFGAEPTSSGFKVYGQLAKICLDLPLQSLVKIEKDGALEFELSGKKLKGRFALIRMKKGDDKNWLLIKMKDVFAKKV